MTPKKDEYMHGYADGWRDQFASERQGPFACPKCGSPDTPKIESGMGLRGTCRNCRYIGGLNEFQVQTA